MKQVCSKCGLRYDCKISNGPDDGCSKYEWHGHWRFNVVVVIILAGLLATLLVCVLTGN